MVSFYRDQFKDVCQEQELLFGEHFSVDGTLIRDWAGHKSFVRKDRKDDDGKAQNGRLMSFAHLTGEMHAKGEPHRGPVIRPFDVSTTVQAELVELLRQAQGDQFKLHQAGSMRSLPLRGGP